MLSSETPTSKVMFNPSDSKWIWIFSRDDGQEILLHPGHQISRDKLNGYRMSGMRKAEL